MTIKLLDNQANPLTFILIINDEYQITLSYRGFHGKKAVRTLGKTGLSSLLQSLQSSMGTTDERVALGHFFSTVGIQNAMLLLEVISPERFISLWQERALQLKSIGHGYSFRKGSVYCAYCGERLIVSNEKKKDGTVYPYFVCNGRHSKRRKDCKTKAVLIDVVEKEIEKIYDSYQLPTKVRILIETYLQKVIADEKRKYESELDGLKGQKAALENKRKKLLEAHYSDAIPLDLMKTEQQKIAKELAAIDREIDLHNITFEQISANLDMVLDIVENCGEAYRNASDTVKKLMNQAIFEKFYISNGPEDEFGVKLTFKAPYDQILDPIKEDLSQINTALKRKPEAVDGLADKAKGHIHDFFGCGPNLGQNKNPYSNESDFFNPNSSSKELMVEARGVEPLSESTLTGSSPGAGGYWRGLAPLVPIPAASRHADPFR